MPEVLTEMRIVSLIDQEDVIERILCHLGLWQEGVRVRCGTDPRGETTLRSVARRPPSPTTTPNRSWRSPATLKRPAAPECAPRTPLFSGPPALRQPAFDFRAPFCHSAPMEAHAFGFRLRANSTFLSAGNSLPVTRIPNSHH